jgi:hypothetical protein
VAVLHHIASEEEWSESRFADRLKEIRSPVDHLIKQAKGVRIDTAITDRVTQVHEVAGVVVQHATDLLEERSTDFTVKELEDELQEFGNRDGTWRGSWRGHRLLSLQDDRGTSSTRVGPKRS